MPTIIPYPIIYIEETSSGVRTIENPANSRPHLLGPPHRIPDIPLVR